MVKWNPPSSSFDFSLASLQFSALFFSLFISFESGGWLGEGKVGIF